MDNVLNINPQKEKDQIVSFLVSTFTEQKISKAVIGISGGVDSATSFALLKEALKPEDIIVAHLYYFKSKFTEIEQYIAQAGIPEKNVHHISIKGPTDEMIMLLHIDDTESNRIRIGNIAARMRMIILFDLAKKYNALVCGTENKTENLLGYFTRFGDQASDIEPLEQLYKTQIFQLAKSLGVPDEVINQKPSAGLWLGQTDEEQFDFTYNEADKVLFLHLEKQLPVEEIEKQGFINAKKILEWRTRNLFKHKTPYTIH